MVAAQQDNSRRYWRLQVALCLVFVAALGVAMLVQGRFRQRQHVRLGKAQRVGALVLRLPMGWTERQTPEGVVFEEPAGNGRKRILEVWYGRVGGFCSPLEHLIRIGEVSERTPREHVQRQVVGGWPGIIVTQMRANRGRQLVACAILSSGRGLVIRLGGEGAGSEADTDLIRRVAESIRAEANGVPKSLNNLDLPDDIHVRLPEGFAGGAADRFRVGRVVIATNARQWLGLELVSCVLASNDVAGFFAAILAFRDGGFDPAAIHAIDGQTWTCKRRDGLGQVYLRVGPDNRALLADFRWLGEPAEGAWRHIGENIRFAEPFDIAARVRAGEVAMEKLGKQPLQVEEEQRWQWYHEASARETWTVVRNQVEGEVIVGEARTDHWPPLSDGAGRVVRWRIPRVQSTGFSLSALAQTLTPTLSQGERENLPLVIGRLPFEPMIIRLESLGWPAPDRWGMAMPVMLEPSFDVPRYLPGEAEPMRCWIVRVSGQAEYTRWYIDRDNRLAVISFPGGLHVQRK